MPEVNTIPNSRDLAKYAMNQPYAQDLENVRQEQIERAKTYPPFENPNLGSLQDVFDIGRATVGMENAPGRYLGKQLGPEAVDALTNSLEAAGLVSLGYGAKKLSKNLTSKGRKKAAEQAGKARNKQAIKLLIQKLSKFGAKRIGLAGLAAGASGVFPPIAGPASLVLGGLSIMDLLADPEMRELIPQIPGALYDAGVDAIPTKEEAINAIPTQEEVINAIPTQEEYKKEYGIMPSALQRETAQREAAKKRTSGLTSLLEGRMKP